jgi:hypothetical protein
LQGARQQRARRLREISPRSSEERAIQGWTTTPRRAGAQGSAALDRVKDYIRKIPTLATIDARMTVGVGSMQRAL